MRAPSDIAGSSQHAKERDTRADWRGNVAYPNRFKGRRPDGHFSVRNVIRTLTRKRPDEPEDWELFI